MASLRSSLRSTPRKRYTVDAFEGIEEFVQQASSESEDGDEVVPEELVDEDGEDDNDDEDDFQADAQPSEPDEDSMSGFEELGGAEELDDRASDAGEADLDDSMSIAGDDGSPAKTATGALRRYRYRKELPPEHERIYTRGVPTDMHTKINKVERHKWLFGPTKDDQGPVMEARDRWTNQRGLPTRKAKRSDLEGFAYNGTLQLEIENTERNWEWYNKDGGKEAFEQRQVIETLTEAQSYLPTDFDLRTFVMGPIKRRKLFDLKVRQSVSMSAAFATDGEGSPSSRSQKNGFVLNLGARVHCVDWAPCQNGPKQYLAASVLPSSRADSSLLESSEAPSFAPQPPHCSSIQIWEVRANTRKDIDESIPPRLRTVLCTANGDIRTFKWCPIPHVDKDRLSLLACISGDGAIRIFDIAKPSGYSRSSNILIEKAAFECRPPNTVCTSLTWISSSRIAAGCANGFLAVWDIDKALQSENENPRPVVYTDISTTYILSITSCYPSFPHFIASTSMSGFVALTDLREPRLSSHAATAVTHRTRIGQAIVVWNDFAHSAVSVEDNHTVRCYPLRRWFTAFGSGKLKGHVTSMAVSLCHPYVLTGSAAGEVAGHNPVRRLVDGGKVPLTQQRWFTHEWRRPNEDEVQAAEDEATDEGDIPAIIEKDGLSRITDGYKPSNAVLNNYTSKAENVIDGAIFSTIYEEKSAVTALAWNPNIHVGGWAAAGMADGLLKIEDVSMI